MNLQFTNLAHFFLSQYVHDYYSTPPIIKHNLEKNYFLPPLLAPAQTSNVEGIVLCRA